MKITWFGHSCFRVETGSSVVLIDPFLKGNPTFEGSGTAWDAATNGVTHVALTHGHDDHVGARSRFARRQAPRCLPCGSWPCIWAARVLRNSSR